jgi:excisionase family DNA binding protein
MNNDYTITAVEAARRLNVGLDYLYSLLWTGKLQGKKVNGRWGVSEQAVNERTKATRNERSGELNPEHGKLHEERLQEIINGKQRR